MTIILVCLNNFQEYILDNIEQLIKLNYKDIYIITNKNFFDNFSSYMNNIILIDSDELTDIYNYNETNKLNKSFRNGFWYLTSLRFFKIYALMDKYNLKDVFHIENDVLLYYNVDKIIGNLDKNYMYIPFDTYKRNIASIIYIPSSSIFKNILDNYDISINDMLNFSTIKKKIGYIKNFPIFPKINAKTDEEKYVSENYDELWYIFDAAAIGQYIGGVHNAPNKIFFINETCVIKYDKYKIYFENENNISKPFLEIENITYPIFNLHIHSKNLKKYMNNDRDFDIIICLGPNDIDVINESILYTKKNIIGYRNIYIISFDNSINVDGAITIDENIFPFNINTLIDMFGSNNRNGWYLQQLLKLYAGQIIPGILDKYLILDSDTFFLKPTEFITEDNKIFLTTGKEFHSPYFRQMNKLDSSLKKIHPLSGISHHSFFITKYIKELMKLVENNYENNYPFWKICLDTIDKESYHRSAFSEYEIYFTYMNLYHEDKIQLRQLKWENRGSLDIDNKNDNDFVCLHYYVRNK